MGHLTASLDAEPFQPPSSLHKPKGDSHVVNLLRKWSAISERSGYWFRSLGCKG